MQAEGREDWVKEEMDALLAPSLYCVDPDNAWRKLRLRNRSGKQLAVVQAVARWREQEAQRLNVPRGRLIKDDTLVEIAHAQPDSVPTLRQIRGFGNHLSESQCRALLAALEASLTLPQEQWPSLPSYKPVNDDMQAVIDLLKLLLKHCAAGSDVVPRLIADADDIESLARGKRDGIAVLHGWRYELYGKAALDLLGGSMVIKVDPAARALEFITSQG
jgi:ribonuclease D